MAWEMLAGAGLSLLEQQRAAEKEKQDRILAGITQMYSPWTNLQAQPISAAPSLLGSVAEGAISGYSQGKKIEQNDANKKLQDLKAQSLYQKLLQGQSRLGEPQVV